MKKKILHVSSGGLSHGGVGAVILSVVQALHNQFDFSCVVFSRKLGREEQFERYGKLYRINCYPKKGKRDYFEVITRPFKLYFGIKRICRKEKFDIIHCHNQRDQWICLLAAKQAGVPIRIAHSHNTNSPKRISWIEKTYKGIAPGIIKRNATKLIGCSEQACLQFFLSDDFTVVHNSVDLDRFSVSKRIENNGINFIHVGRFTYQKNQDFVLNTFAEICKSIDNAKLFLVGFGSDAEVERLKSLIVSLGIEDSVEMVPGDKVDVVDYYKKSDYMIFPSRFEGFGIVLVEAQAMGIQCYVSENIQPEVNVGLLQFLNLSDGSKKWAECIVSDIQNGRKGCCDMSKLLQYSDEVISRQYADLYNGNI